MASHKKKGGLGGLISQKQLPAVITAAIVVVVILLLAGTNRLPGFLKSQANIPNPSPSVYCTEYSDTTYTMQQDCEINGYAVLTGNTTHSDAIQLANVGSQTIASMECDIGCGCSYSATPTSVTCGGERDATISNSACSGMPTGVVAAPGLADSVTVSVEVPPVSNPDVPTASNEEAKQQAFAQLRAACSQAVGTQCNDARCTVAGFAPDTSKTTLTCRECLATTPTPVPTNTFIPGEVCYDSWLGIVEVACPTPVPANPGPCPVGVFGANCPTATPDPCPFGIYGDACRSRLRLGTPLPTTACQSSADCSGLGPSGYCNNGHCSLGF